MGEAFEHRLARELPGWVADGVVDDDQAAAITRRYSLPDPSTLAVPAPPVGSRGNVVRALAVIGAVLVGLGVILFFASNWDGMSRALRLVTLVVATCGAYAAGMYLHEHAARPRRTTGAALLLVGVMLYGASIFLVGQTYHVQAHDPFALLAWSAGAFAIALATRITAIGYLAVLTLVGWVAFELGSLGGDLVPGTMLAPFAALGFALYLAGTAEPALARVGLRGSPRHVGLVVAGLATYVLTFDDVHRASNFTIDGRDLPDVPWQASAFVVAFSLLALAAALRLVARRGERTTAPWEAACALVIVALTVVAAYVDPMGTAGTIVFNVAMAVLALGALIAGYVAVDAWLVGAGIALVVLDVFTRYFDFAWDLMPRSLVFVGAGLLLLAIGFVLERSRDDLAERLRGDDA